MPRVPLALALVAVFGMILTVDGSIPAADAQAQPREAVAPTSAPKPAAPKAGEWLEGSDVSTHQGRIDWAKVAAAGKSFVYARASAGTLTRDDTYTANRSGARANGLAVGAYHFANPDTAPNDALNEANWFLGLATPASGDLIPVLDIEVNNGLGPAALTTWLQTWLARVTEATGVRPAIYTSPNFWKTSVGDTDWFARNGYTVLWTAHWTKQSTPLVPAANWAGNGWTYWQYSSSGRVAGINARVDLDRYHGTTIAPELFIP